MFSLRNDMAPYEEIDNTIIQGSKLQGTNACVLILAILVASIGLNMNSTAVIIGAMLISPLMGGITAIAYGIATNDLKLAKWSAFRLSIQVIVSIATSAIYFKLSPMTQASSELLARTSPTIWDVLIAICGGLAGIIGQTRKEKSNVIPGVAIATALMPPLCTAGYGLAHWQLSYFWGALYLFFINGFFICVTAIVVLKYLRVPQFKELSKKALGKIHRNIVFIAIITMIPSIVLAVQIVRDTIEANSAQTFISTEFSFDGTQIVTQNIDSKKNTIDISLIGAGIDDSKIVELQNMLPDYGLSGYKLNISQTKLASGVTEDEVAQMLQSEESTNEENVSAVILQKENEDLKAQNDELQSQLDSYENDKIDMKQLGTELVALNPKIKGAVGANADIYVSDSSSEDTEVIITLLVNKNLTETELSTIKNWLYARLDNQNAIIIQQKYSDTGL